MPVVRDNFPAEQRMRPVHVICTNGREWKTSINGTNEQINRYFLGERFERADESGSDTCTNVIFLDGKVL
jgi:hypothetical protein